MLRYAELHPEDLSRAFATGAPAILPIGALEWHGSHLPLGVDLFIAEAFSERLGELVNAVLMPALITPVTTLPHPMSLQVGTEGFRIVMDDTLTGLIAAGAEKILIVTGHYAQGHEIELYEAAMRTMDDHAEVYIFAAAPLEPIGDDELLDHAARIETALMMAIRPDLVRLDALEAGVLAVLGEHPRLATSEQGEDLIAQGLASWKKWIEIDRMALGRWYGTRFDTYQPYVDAYYKNSWEDAITAWWSDKTAT